MRREGSNSVHWSQEWGARWEARLGRMVVGIWEGEEMAEMMRRMLRMSKVWV